MPSCSRIALLFRIGYLLFAFALLLLVSMTCSRIKYIKFLKHGKSVENYSLTVVENKLVLSLKGAYWFSGPGLDLFLDVVVKYPEGISDVEFRAENISLTFDNTSVNWLNPRDDSNYIEITDEYYRFTKHFRKISLEKDEIEYLKDTEYPLEICLENFIILNDIPVYIDTIYATSPGLTYYDNWRD